jgi:hypothetical protein
LAISNLTEPIVVLEAELGLEAKLVKRRAKPRGRYRANAGSSPQPVLRTELTASIAWMRFSFPQPA